MIVARRGRRGVLLAGGKGRRFGGVAKGLMPMGSTRMADAPLAALCEICDDVVIAANDPDADTWFDARHRVVRDAVPRLGALGALDTALRASDGAVVIVCAWDVPFMRADVLDRLATVVENGASCCVPVHADGTSEPLCAAYGPLCADVARALLASGATAAQSLWREAAGTPWSIEQMLTPALAARTFFNVNTPDDLRLAESWLSPHHQLT